MAAAPKDAPPLTDGFVRLVSSIPLRSDRDRVAAMLDEGSTPWAEGLVALPATSEFRRYAVDLRLRVNGPGAALATFRKAAYLDLGRPRRTVIGWEAEISWRASSAAPLFPVFSGWLIIGPDELRIEGLYAPPGGVFGRVADRMLFHVAANGTARWLLNEIDRAALGPPS